MRRAVLIVLAVAMAGAALAWTPTDVKQDPLVRMPGSQPAPEGNVTLEAPGRCLNCHSGYNPSVEPGTNWMGSMMAQSARDFLFYACMTTAAQDSIWAIGTPNATDICARCHFPKGWLEGRSDPTNASSMTGADFDGVQCDFCHTAFDPFFETTFDGSREGNDWQGYWDETNASGTPSDSAALLCRDADQQEASSILQFNGDPFFTGNLPTSPAYDENGSGQYFQATTSDKRASFADAAARHQMLYSRYHKSKYFCGTCHDVSNPVLANLGADPTLALPTEVDPAYSYFHVERTFSEFMLSDYGQAGGSDGLGPFAPDQFETSNPGNAIAMCQDCHMRDVIGAACDKRGVPIRPIDSVEHPQSGQPLHDLTGGNAWVSAVLASAVPGSPNYDAINDTLLNQGPAILTLDLTAGEGINPVALLAGSERAKQQLLLAASIDTVALNGQTLTFRVQNQTGHKLISGFPEGRRMFVNIKAFDGTGNLIYEINPYDNAAGTLKGLADGGGAGYHYSYDGAHGPEPVPDPANLDPANEIYLDELVYEAHPTSSLTGEQHTFHFALATGRYKDNRIPPKGFRIAQAAERLSQPVWEGVEDEGYFTAAEYAGGYDEVSVTVPSGTQGAEINLYYQTTSREYIEFLRDEINGSSNTLSGTGAGGDPAYLVQTDPFFDQLKAWGDTIWDLWSHNRNLDGAAPFLMTQATAGNIGGGTCGAPIPTLLSATPGQQQVSITWSDEHSGDAQVGGYNVYYDQAAKGQYIAQVGPTTSYTDSGLTNGQQYCFKVTSYYDTTCESGFSNVLCAIPNNQGQAEVGVSTLQTGKWTGKGKNQEFLLTSTFTRGDSVVVQGRAIDTSTGLPLANATVDLEISGPESVVLTSGPTGTDGWFEVIWNTQAPDKKGQGGTAPGSYTATVSGVVADGYSWDGAGTSAGFTLE